MSDTSSVDRADAFYIWIRGKAWRHSKVPRLGKPVYRHDIPANDIPLADKLVGLFAGPVMRRWLEEHEKKGDFKFTDAKLRSSFYHYWTTQDHGSFLTDDKEQIREFLEPEWALKRPGDN